MNTLKSMRWLQFGSALLLTSMLAEVADAATVETYSLSDAGSSTPLRFSAMDKASVSQPSDMAITSYPAFIAPPSANPDVEFNQSPLSSDKAQDHKGPHLPLKHKPQENEYPLTPLAQTEEILIAQIQSDGTLGNSDPLPTIVDGSPADLIMGGVTNGSNRFHSFEEFNVNTDQRVYFDANGVDTIFSRVTGDNMSKIDGTLGVTEPADLFLLNPNGVMFGPNSQLDISGAFTVTTADRLNFADGNEFNVNSTMGEVLSISVPLGIQLADNPQGRIVIDGELDHASSSDLTFHGSAIRVNGRLRQSGGGDIQLRTPQNIEGSFVDIHGGQVNTDVEATGGGGSIGIVTHDLQVRGNNAQVSASTNGDSDAGNVVIGATGNVTVKGENSGIISQVYSNEEGEGRGGSIGIRADNILVRRGGRISATTDGNGGAGRVIIEAAGNVTVKGPTSNISSRVRSQGDGNTGIIDNFDLDNELATFTNITSSNLTTTLSAPSDTSDELDSFTEPSTAIDINAHNLRVRNGGQISTSTNGSGNARKIDINATRNVFLRGGESRITSRVRAGADANSDSRGMDVAAGNRLLLRNGAFISASTASPTGFAGRIDVEANRLIIRGVNPEDSDGLFNRSRLTARATEAGGYAKNIRIDAERVLVQDGGRIVASNINTLLDISDNENPDNDGTNIRFVGLERLEVFNDSRISSLTESGTAGFIQINVNDEPAERVEVTDNSLIRADASQRDGFASNITMNTINLLVNEDSIISTENRDTISDETRGNIILENIEFLEVSNSSEISTLTRSGKAGNITINRDTFTPANRIELRNNSRLRADALLEAGEASSILINAKNLSIQNNSDISTSNVSSSTSNGGVRLENLNILEISDRSEIATFTRRGQAGEITVGSQTSHAERVYLGQRSILNSESGTGNAGNIRIYAQELDVQDSEININSRSNGSAGSLTVDADLVHLDQGLLNAQTGTEGSNNSANITANISGPLLRLSNDSLISAEARNNANGGNIRLRAENGFILGGAFENSDIIANADVGKGGNIDINTQSLIGFVEREGRTTSTLHQNVTSDISASSEEGLDGTITISTLGLEPDEGLTELPTLYSSPPIQQGCSANALGSSSFNVSGRGGIPHSPTDILSRDRLLADLGPEPETFDFSARQSGLDELAYTHNASVSVIEDQRVVEAQGLIKGDDGQVTFVTQAPESLGYNDWNQSLHCDGTSVSPL